jgi:hypothetical protein
MQKYHARTNAWQASYPGSAHKSDPTAESVDSVATQKPISRQK